MARSNVYVTSFRRKRQGKTNYKSRLKLLLSNKPRVVVRASLKNIIAQVVEYKQKGDKIVVSSSSNEIKKMGWKASRGNIPTAYLVGYLLAKKSAKTGIKDVIFDIGFQCSIKGSRIFALLKGLVDGGMNIPHNPEVLPNDNRAKGAHIAEYAKKLKSEDKDKYARQFAQCIKDGMDPEKMIAHFEEIKKKVENK